MEVYLEPTILHRSFPEPALQSTLKGPVSNERQSRAAASSWILPNLNAASLPQLWEHGAQGKYSKQRAEGSGQPLPAAGGRMLQTVRFLRDD